MLASVALVAVVLVSMVGGTTGGGTATEPSATAAENRSWRSAVTPPRLASPLGQRLVTLTLTGLAVVDLDNGSFDELDLGAVRSYGAAPALAPLDTRRVAVLFADRSVAVVDLEQRSITRVAEDVQAVFPTPDAGGFWVRRAVAGGWELTQMDSNGRAISVAMRFPPGAPPRMVAGRPVIGPNDGAVVVSPPDGPYLVEVREERQTLSSYDVVITDPVSGRRHELTGLDQLPVVSSDGRRLLVAEAVGNRLSVYDLDRWTAETVDVPRSGAVGLDWGNAVLLPPPVGEPAAD